MDHVHNPHYCDGSQSYQEKFPIVVSYYTVETLYQVEIQNLLASCEKFGLQTSIEGVPSFGSWELNCAYKPFFLYKKLQELQQPILWVDADGIFDQKPTPLSCFSADIATRIDPSLSPDHPSKVVSSTVYVNYTPKGAHLLQLWAEECKRQLSDPDRTEEFWDQIALRNILLPNPAEAIIASLPLSYTKIFDHPLDQEKVLNPVITHYQASRRLKKTI